MIEKKSDITTSALVAMAKFIKENPKLLLGLIAGSVAAAYGVNKIVDLSQKLHPLDQIIKERQKLSIFNQQKQIMESLLKSNIDIRNSMINKPVSNRIYPPLS